MPIAALRVPTAAYLHVPFCAHRCGYCDFTLVARRDDLVGDYLRALELELQLLGTPRPVETLFIGGGTPTHLSSPQLDRLLILARTWFPPAGDCEFSVEANPQGLSDEKIAVLADHGVNRVSLGVQSFDLDVLKTLERDHDAHTVVATVERLRRRIDNISFDLIFGVPGQTLETWQRTLDQCLELAPQHVSTYGLTIEKGTAFWSRRRTGALGTVSDELERAMYAAAMDELRAAGFEQYELSNFALPGRQCRHNDTYWGGLPYYGAGPGAARYLAGRRETNHRSVTTWISRILSGRSAIGDAEELSPEDRAREALVLGLRRTCGVAAEEFRAATGFDVDALTAGRLARHLAAGWIERTATNLRLTREGRFVADTLVVDLL